MAGTPLLLFRKAPFLKFLPALMAGIMLQWHFDFTLSISICIFIAGFTGLAIFRSLSLRNRFFYKIAGGISITAVFIGLGSLLTYQKDIRNHKDWVGNHYQSGDAVVVSLNEPLIEKQNL
jgi:competence protein ComEC